MVVIKAPDQELRRKWSEVGLRVPIKYLFTQPEPEAGVEPAVEPEVEDKGEPEVEDVGEPEGEDKGEPEQEVEPEAAEKDENSEDLVVDFKDLERDFKKVHEATRNFYWLTSLVKDKKDKV